MRSGSHLSTTASPCCILTGINQYESDKPARYVSNTNLSSRVASLNPSWNGDQSEEASNAQFQKAMQLTGHEFMEALDYYSNVSVHTACSASAACHVAYTQLLCTWEAVTESVGVSTSVSLTPGCTWLGMHVVQLKKDCDMQSAFLKPGC